MYTSSFPMPEYQIAPNQYTVDALTPLLDHPDLAPNRVGELDATALIGAYANMGRAALAHEDLDEFRQWKLQMIAFACAVSGDANNDEMKFLSAKNVTLNLEGVTMGDKHAADALHKQLDRDSGGAYLEQVVGKLADSGLPANIWIDRHTQNNPDRIATAWQIYLNHRKDFLQKQGNHAPQIPELMVPGAEALPNLYLGNKLSNETIIKLASSVFDLMQDKQDKRRVLTVMQAAINEQIQQPGGLEGQLIADAMSMAIRLNQDPDFSLAEKQAFAQQFNSILPDWNTPFIPSRADFELSNCLAREISLAEVLGEIEKIAQSQLQTTDIKRVRRASDYIIREAVEQYLARNDADSAATIMSQIDLAASWLNAFKNYVDHGHDIAPVAQAQHFENAFSSPQAPGHFFAKAIAAVQHTQGGDFSAAEATILEMAAGVGRNYGDIEIVEYLVEQLLAHNAASTQIAAPLLEILSDNPEFRRHSTMQEIFIKNGSEEMKTALWERVQDPMRYARPTPAEYFIRYASAALASATKR